MDEKTLKYMPTMLTGIELDEALKVEPDYDISIRNTPEANRLIALQDLYSIYIPTDMSREIYSKLYLSLLRSMNKKQSLMMRFRLHLRSGCRKTNAKIVFHFFVRMFFEHFRKHVGKRKTFHLTDSGGFFQLSEKSSGTACRILLYRWRIPGRTASCIPKVGKQLRRHARRLTHLA